jgi:hypothetical protein
VDQIEFVVAEEKLPTGSSERVEPVINGASLVEIIEQAEGRSPHYAGLAARRVLD